jgi:hypothetical protein
VDLLYIATQNSITKTSVKLMGLLRIITLLLLVMACSPCIAQTDSAIKTLQQLPLKYINQLDGKIDKYSKRISSKTEKALQKLAKWETKIQNLLQKLNPQAAENLFGNNQTTFTTLLQKIQEGKTIAMNYQAQYDEYRDKLSTSMVYLQTQKAAIKDKLVKPIAEANQKLTELEEHVKNSEALQQFIKERKRQLIEQSMQYLGSNKYLQKISKESYYYVETLRNYKELFYDKKKAEQAALGILNKIPAFTKFVQQNSMLAQLFGVPGSRGGGVAALTGLQTRAQVQQQIQSLIGSAGGPNITGSGQANAQALIQQNIKDAQEQLNKLKEKLSNATSGTGGEMPEGFKPNNQKTKTFLKRLEYGTNFQSQKSSSFLPTTTDIGLSVGYRLNDKSQIGLGSSMKIGWGKSISNIQLSGEGFSIRSFVDIKLKGSFFITGGYEQNYRTRFYNTQQLSNQPDNWTSSGLLGLSKTVSIKSKFFKKTKIQAMYDLLWKKQIPVMQPFLFRTGYNF